MATTTKLLDAKRLLAGDLITGKLVEKNLDPVKHHSSGMSGAYNANV